MRPSAEPGDSQRSAHLPSGPQMWLLLLSTARIGSEARELQAMALNMEISFAYSSALVATQPTRVNQRPRGECSRGDQRP